MIVHAVPGSISSLDDISFSPMASALTKDGSDVSVFSNGMVPADFEPSRSSLEVSTPAYVTF